MDTATLLRVNRALQRRTVRSLAQEVGVEPITIWRWESGRSPIPPNQAEKVMRALLQPAGTGDDRPQDAA